jgi:hypothetical protein
MKRDMDLIRRLLLELEEKDLGNGQWVDFDVHDGEEIKVTEHLFLLSEAGFIEGNNLNTLSDRMFKARRLTWSGHDFVDSIRNDDTWRKTKDGALAAGGWTVDLLRDLAKGLIKKQIEELTGVKL